MKSLTVYSRLKKIICVGLVLALVPFVASCGTKHPRSLVESIKNGSVILGVKYDQPGLGMRTPTKDIIGIDSDVSRYVVSYIANKYNVPEPQIQWKESPSAQREMFIQNGEVDMIAATYSINAGRMRAVDFGGPYLVTHQGLLVRADATDMNTLEDLKGKKLCSVSGATPAQNVKNRLDNVQLQEFDTYSSCVEALYQHKVDAVTTDEVILLGYKQQYSDSFKVLPMRNDDDSFWTNEYYGMGVPKGNTQDVSDINEALTQLYAKGDMEGIISDNLGDADIDTSTPPIGDLSFTETPPVTVNKKEEE